MKLPRSRHRRPPTIPIVSMADIAFLLIIFFMVTTTFVRESGLTVQLPGAHSAQMLEKLRDVNVTIGRGGALQVDGQRIGLQELPGALQQRMRALRTDSVLIRADRQVVYQDLVQVIDVAKSLGARVSLAVEKLAAPPLPPQAADLLGASDEGSAPAQ